LAFFSFPFLFFLAVLVLLYSRESNGWRRKQVFLTLANLVFLATYIHHGGDAWAFAAYILVSYCLLRLTAAFPSGRLLAFSIGLALAALIAGNRYAFLSWVSLDLSKHTLELIGLSYMTLKLIHMFVDLRQGQLAAFTLPSYVNYQLAFFSLPAGPILRYNEFYKRWLGPEGVSGRDLIPAWNRILNGLIQLGLLAAVASEISDYSRGAARETGAAGPALGWFLLSFYAYPAYVFFNFSGYCNVAIGAARLLGYSLPENFDRPYLARNMQDFWNRWHITLTHWIRDYLFTPLYKRAAEWRPGAAETLGYGVSFFALVLAGIWHGSSWNFLAFGVVHGAGVASCQMWGAAIKKRFGRAAYKVYMADRRIHALAVLVTFHYVCFSFLFFRPGFSSTLNLLRLVVGKFL
jgi:D-alanyl-lipoteichoic acid acyltransferase DltB (MBOAT superfamily)